MVHLSLHIGKILGNHTIPWTLEGDCIVDGESDVNALGGSTVPNLSLTTSLQGTKGVQGSYALVRGGSSASNLLEPSRPTALQR